MIYGYARVSTQEQNLDLQVKELQTQGVKKIITEKQSAFEKRPRLMSLKKN